MTIKELRQASGLSQSRFAEKYHISVRTLQQWEQNKSTPPDYIPDLIRRLAAYESRMNEYSIETYRLAKKESFKICIEEPFSNCEKIYPIQQRKVKELIDDICDHIAPKKIIIFGSSVTERCHIGSDVDIYAELPYNQNPIQKFHDFEYDFWTNFSVDRRLYSEILRKGICVYG